MGISLENPSAWDMTKMKQRDKLIPILSWICPIIYLIGAIKTKKDPCPSLLCSHILVHWGSSSFPQSLRYYPEVFNFHHIYVLLFTSMILEMLPCFYLCESIFRFNQYCLKRALVTKSFAIQCTFLFPRHASWLTFCKIRPIWSFYAVECYVLHNAVSVPLVGLYFPLPQGTYYFKHISTPG